MTPPLVLLAHRIVEATLQQVGLALPLPPPTEAIWISGGPAEVVLLDVRADRRIASVYFECPYRPKSAVIELHVARLALGIADPPARRELTADVSIGLNLLDDIFGEAPR